MKFDPGSSGVDCRKASEPGLFPRVLRGQDNNEFARVFQMGFFFYPQALLPEAGDSSAIPNLTRYFLQMSAGR